MERKKTWVIFTQYNLRNISCTHTTGIFWRVYCVHVYYIIFRLAYTAGVYTIITCTPAATEMKWDFEFILNFFSDRPPRTYKVFGREMWEKKNLPKRTSEVDCHNVIPTPHYFFITCYCYYTNAYSFTVHLK